MSPGPQQLRSIKDRCLCDGHVVHLPITRQMVLTHRSSSFANADAVTARTKGRVCASAQQLGRLSPCMSGVAETEGQASEHEKLAL